MGKDSCSSQTTKAGSEFALLVASSYLFGACFYHRLSVETLSPANGREVHQSFERSLPTRN